jgi:AraC-like DNA-binding protein
MAELAGSGQGTGAGAAGLTGREGFDAWNQAVSAAFVPLKAISRSPDSFSGGLTTQSVGQTLISQVSGESLQVSRTARSIAANDPGWLKLGLQLHGYSVVAQDGREAALTPGDFAIYDTARPYDLYFDDAFHMLVVMFPPGLLQIDAGTAAGLTASRVSGRSGLGALTSTLLRSIGGQLTAGGVPADLSVSDAALALITATFAERIRSDKRPVPRQEALRLQVEQYMAAHLADPALTVPRIAAEHHISVRYLQRLFEDSGETVSGWIRRRRLDKCRKDLANPLMEGRPVAAVGMHWGFTDASSFSRAFKAAFGHSPAEFRYSAGLAADGGRVESLSASGNG